MTTELGVRPIQAVAKDLGLAEADWEQYGRGKAKLSLDLLARPARAKGRLVLVTAINPTPAGEGKTTTSISLAMGMRRLGMNAVLDYLEGFWMGLERVPAGRDGLGCTQADHPDLVPLLWASRARTSAFHRAVLLWVRAVSTAFPLASRPFPCEGRRPCTSSSPRRALKPR